MRCAFSGWNFRFGAPQVMERMMDFEASRCVGESAVFDAWKAQGLSTRTAWVLASQGVDTIAGLTSHPETVMLRWPNFGRKSLNEIYEFLEREGHPLPPKRDKPWPNHEAELASLYAKLSGHMQEVAKLKQRISALEAKEG